LGGFPRDLQITRHYLLGMPMQSVTTAQTGTVLALPLHANISVLLK
jgi:hypothetical protein